MKLDEAIERLTELRQSGDTEMAHYEADKVLCSLLRRLGYDYLVDQYEAIKKWYA